MAHSSEHRQYMIFAVSELSTIDFNEVLETSESTVRRSVDGLETFVKWDSAGIPASVDALTTKEGPYNHAEIATILLTPEWTAP